MTFKCSELLKLGMRPQSLSQRDPRGTPERSQGDTRGTPEGHQRDTRGTPEPGPEGLG